MTKLSPDVAGLAGVPESEGVVDGLDDGLGDEPLDFTVISSKLPVDFSIYTVSYTCSTPEPRVTWSKLALSNPSCEWQDLLHGAVGISGIKKYMITATMNTTNTILAAFISIFIFII